MVAAESRTSLFKNAESGSGALANPTEEKEDEWKTIMSKRKRKCLHRGSAQLQAPPRPKTPKKWQYEYKIRLARSRVSVKTLLPKLEIHLQGTEIATAFSMHLIEKANTISVRVDSKESTE